MITRMGGHVMYTTLHEEAGLDEWAEFVAGLDRRANDLIERRTRRYFNVEHRDCPWLFYGRHPRHGHPVALPLEYWPWWS